MALSFLWKSASGRAGSALFLALMLAACAATECPDLERLYSSENNFRESLQPQLDARLIKESNPETL